MILPEAVLAKGTAWLASQAPKGRVMHNKGTKGGVVVQFGACQDEQVAADTRKLAQVCRVCSL